MAPRTDGRSSNTVGSVTQTAAPATESNAATSSAQPVVHHQKDGNVDQTSRTSQSLTFCDSWTICESASANAKGVDLDPLSAHLFGVEFLPFEPPKESNVDVVVDPEEAEIEVPNVVEITPAPPDTLDEQDDKAAASSPLRQRGTPATPAETEELQQLLVRSSKKKNRFRRAAQAVLQRVKSGKKNPSTTGKRKSSRLVVDTAPQLDEQISSSSWISPTATAITDDTASPTDCAPAKESKEEALHAQTRCLRAEAETQERDIRTTHSEIEGLQSQLASTIEKYQAQLSDLQATQAKLLLLASNAEATAEASEKSTPNEEIKKELKRSESGAFMRAHDLDTNLILSRSSEDDSFSSLSHSGHNGQGANQVPTTQVPTPEFLLMDHYLVEIVSQLMSVGFDLAIDETTRFEPTRDTAKLLSQMPETAKTLENGWPIQPWTPAWDKHVLVWMGSVSHKGFGHTWPVVKGRTILHTSARNLLNYLWDSSLVPLYNPLCQGRQDLYTFQDDVNMTESESPYGFAGCAKIVRSLNKHRLLPKAMEMKILLFARPLEQHPGSYALVSRSVWENDSAKLDNKAAKNVIRTEMLMGCTILRAIDENSCEMTNLTQFHSPGVPEYLARKTSPGQCHGMMKNFQSLFS